uniref:Cyclin-dependent kinases regulatory subunit n=1 Tax=Caenorhabditis tropicalis TaxID=1561998 RepID=A0A1I7TK21_9PELO
MDDIYYSPRYADDEYEYRHVILPQVIARQLPKEKLLSEAEWRRVGVTQSLGWEHYMVHRPEKHILLFRRPLNFSKADEERAKQILMRDMDEYEKCRRNATLNRE